MSYYFYCKSLGSIYDMWEMRRYFYGMSLQSLGAHVRCTVYSKMVQNTREG